MTTIDYKKVFSKLSHIKALSHDQKFDEIVQNVIVHALDQCTDPRPKNERELANKIEEIYGIAIRPPVILSNLDRLLTKGEVVRIPSNRQLTLESSITAKIRDRIQLASNLELQVKTAWFAELGQGTPQLTEEKKEIFWGCLRVYLFSVFEQHGIQTLHLLNPTLKANEEEQKSLNTIVEIALRDSGNAILKEELIIAINQFIANADISRTTYLSQLADSTFTCFALTSDSETVNFLNQRYNNLKLFLDTNFIFGILGLHKNTEDGSAKELLDEVIKNKLPFKLGYHPETLAEFRRAFDQRALRITAARWTKESSHVALASEQLSPLEDLFHRQNIDNEIDPRVFLEKYDHVDIILKDLGLLEFNPQGTTTDEEHVEVESDIERYQAFYESVPNRKPKYYLQYKHDVIVIREVRRLNPKRTKFLESHAFFVSSDYILSKFERLHYKRGWEINYVVSPSVFLQLIRPFIENDYSANKRFIDTFSIPEVRTFEIDYSSTRSKALQILNDNYHHASFETKVKILRDQVLMEKLDQANEDHDKQVTLVEAQIALENELLAKEKETALTQAQKSSAEKIQAETERDTANLLREEATKEKSEAFSLAQKAVKQATQKEQEIEALKGEHKTVVKNQSLLQKREMLGLINSNIKNTATTRQQLKRIIEDRVKARKYTTFGCGAIFIILELTLIAIFSWQTMEVYTYVASSIFLVLGYGYLAIVGESFSLKKYFQRYERLMQGRIYAEYGFDENEYNKQYQIKENLEKEINALERE